MDSSALSFLTAKALEVKREEQQQTEEDEEELLLEGEYQDHGGWLEVVDDASCVLLAPQLTPLRVATSLLRLCGKEEGGEEEEEEEEKEEVDHDVARAHCHVTPCVSFKAILLVSRM